MNLLEASKLALDALYMSRPAYIKDALDKHEAAIAALRAAIEQCEAADSSIPEYSYSSGIRFDLPDQHVLEVVVEPDYWDRGHFVQGTRPHINWFQIQKLPIGTKLYTHPASPTEKEVVAYLYKSSISKFIDWRGPEYWHRVEGFEEYTCTPLYTLENLT